MRVLFLSWLTVLAFSYGSLAADKPVPLRVYTYDSFTGKGSLGALMSQRFLQEYGVPTEFVTFSSAGEALNQIALEAKSPRADIIVGIDNSLVARARALQVFSSLDGLGAGIPPELFFDSTRTVLPFDYGDVALVYDRTRTKALPTSLKEFSLSPAFHRKLALEDPRTSSVGLAFLIWTVANSSKEGTTAFWKALGEQILTVAPGWSGAYGLFLQKEADWVVSYTTSPAYHIEKEKTDNIRAVIFPEGHYRQVEGVAVLKHSAQSSRAREWVKMLLSRETQTALPLLQWMYPAMGGVELPASFKKLPVSPRVVSVDPTTIESSKAGWLKEWTNVLSRRP
jgi:thiamine transport system substrate-binding protein